MTIDRHRNDTAPYVFKTEDRGKTWKSIAGNLPASGSVHVIRADPRKRDLLFVGTEFGLFVSTDGGRSWQPFGKGLPTVAVHDLVIHPRHRELVIATHGRSIYIVDVAPLEELTAKVLHVASTPVRNQAGHPVLVPARTRLSAGKITWRPTRHSAPPCGTGSRTSPSRT